ncbi:oxidoreductase [Paenibacillus crassostreae]|uniref:Nucleoside-diphosphate sugar epimerase n=1 Tax=Paenibacillus crassostreae TaxID=1763538 RepID=A0A167BSL6_9BACL|nr:oxidoreductase [Paenibacillus crassostreae]AOZ92450.1 nucleoside-diphosphate sugar epimerase [Paenibacillus crassostreae]OAB72398.1 nucleoside-diphosphate sugar epimerase [Paenibacillus crassostreae]
MKLQAVVLGASGLVGSFVVAELLQRDEYDGIKLLVRQPLDIQHPKLSQIVVDWDRLDQYHEIFSNVRDVYCCLGTTIKKAGSQEQFRKVDYDYPVRAAQLAQEQGVSQFLVVSAMGADPSSRVFYNRTKGEVEDKLSTIGLPAVHLFRPSLLLGQRQEKRLGEQWGAKFMTTFDFLFRGKGIKYRAIPARVVARAMVNIAIKRPTGVHIYPNDVIHILGLV